MTAVERSGRGSRGIGQAGRGPAFPARHAPVHRRPARTRAPSTRCSCAPGSRTRRSRGIDASEAAAAPGVVGVYTAADLDLEPFPTAGPAGRHAGGDAPPGAGHATRCASSASRSRSSWPRRARRPSTPPRSSTSTTTRSTCCRHDQGARRRRAEALPDERQPRRRRARGRGRARRRRGARRRALHQPAPRRRADGAERRAGRARPGDGRLHPVHAEPGPARLPGRDLQVDRDREGQAAGHLDRDRRRLRRAHRVLPGADRRGRAGARARQAPCATSRRARRRCSRCSTAARRCRTSRSAAPATARSPG